MIKLAVQEYCHGCLDFNPTVEVIYAGGIPYMQLVHCVDRDKCLRMHKRLNKLFGEKHEVKENRNATE